MSRYYGGWCRGHTMIGHVEAARCRRASPKLGLYTHTVVWVQSSPSSQVCYQIAVSINTSTYLMLSSLLSRHSQQCKGGNTVHQLSASADEEPDRQDPGSLSRKWAPSQERPKRLSTDSSPQVTSQA